jgi:flagellar hook assembly protein FlgD
MAFDPTKPVEGTEIDARQAQIVALQTLVNQKASLDDVNQAIATASPRNVDGFVFSSDDISDPPQKVEVEVEDIQNQLSNLVQALGH